MNGCVALQCGAVRRCGLKYGAAPCGAAWHYGARSTAQHRNALHGCTASDVKETSRLSVMLVEYDHSVTNKSA